MLYENLTCLNNPNNLQKDFIIITSPWTDSNIPLMAPAALKPIVESTGLSCLAVDLNADVFNITKTHPRKNELVEFFFDGKTTAETAKELEELFTQIATNIKSFNPKYVGISLFSYVCRHAGEWISYFIKKSAPNIKIVIGGAGCLGNFTGSAHFADSLKSRGLIDHHIIGDGEHSLIALINKDLNYPGIDNPVWKELTNAELTELPIPNYDDYDFTKYNKKSIALLASRGCVRKCKFCDIVENWKNFRWRDSDNVFQEMVLQYNKYGIRSFKFQDSLINGSQTQFRRLLQLLSDWNKRNPNKSFSWGSYFIFREIVKGSEEEWQMIADSGAQALAVGIENLNQHIRYDIGKKFSDESIVYHFEQAKKHNIKITMLNIVGYITETRKDIDYIKSWLDENTRFKDILMIQWGATLGIFPNTYLDKNKEKLGITMIGDSPPMWLSTSTDSTPAIRASWAIELQEYSRKLGYNTVDMIDNHYLLETLLKE